MHSGLGSIKLINVPSELSYVIKLIDDPDPSVKSAVEEYLVKFSGDLSEEIAGEAISLTAYERKELSRMLMPGRRKTLAQNWQLPTQFKEDQGTDWETFEFLLSLLSDYLHDGITLRPSLADSIDQLCDEAQMADATSSTKELCRFLFNSSRYMGNKNRYFAHENSDITWVIHNTFGNPLSLVVIYMLLANRFGLEVHGCNYPGHFLAWVPDETPYLVDCYNRGRILHPRELIRDNPALSPTARTALNAPCTFRLIINRLINNIDASYEKEEILTEKTFLERLKKSLKHQPVA